MNRKMLAVGLATVAGVAASATARPSVYSSGFESPPYVAGTGSAGQLITGAGATGTVGPGQDSWAFFSSSVLSSNPHVINNASESYQGSNYLRVNTGSGTGGFGSSTSTRSTFTYHGGAFSGDTVSAGALAGKVLHVSVAVYIENIVSATRTTSMEIQVYDQAFTLQSAMRIQSNGIFAIFNNAGQGIGLGGATNDTWYRFDMYFDTTTAKAYYFINGFDQSGVLDGAGFSRAWTATDYFETDLVDIRHSSATGNSSQGHIHRWDAFSVDLDDVPAPSTAALIGLGGLLAARRRRS